MFLKLARNLLATLVIASSSTTLCAETVVQSFLYTQIFGTSLIERLVASKGSLESVYILVPNAEPRVEGPIMWLGTADTLNSVYGQTLVKQDMTQALSRVMSLFTKHLIDVEPVLILHDTTRASQLLALEFKTYLTNYKPDMIRISSESHLRRVLSEKKARLIINLVTTTGHEESGTTLLYRETVELVQQWSNAIDIGLIPSSTICLCINEHELIKALSNGPKTLVPKVVLNIRALQRINSRLYIDAINDIDSVELTHAD